jgi:hypothetical protein
MTQQVIQAWTAAKFNDMATIQRLVPDVVHPDASTHSEDDPIHTLLMCAAAHGSVACAEYLIKQNADVNKKNYMGYTALHWSAYSGRTECIEVLLVHGGDLEMKTQDGKTPLLVAVSRGHLTYVECIVAKGADVLAVSSNGWSAIFFAVAGGHKNVCQYLVTLGVDWRCPDVDRVSIMKLAEEWKRSWVAGILTVRTPAVEEEEEETGSRRDASFSFETTPPGNAKRSHSPRGPGDKSPHASGDKSPHVRVAHRSERKAGSEGSNHRHGVSRSKSLPQSRHHHHPS